MKRIILIALAALVATSATAFATRGDDGVPPSAMNGVTHAVKVNGALKARSVGHLQLKNQIVDCQKLVPVLQRRVCGPQQVGLDGPKGDKGATGGVGAKGDVGKQGGPGGPGDTGPKGDAGAPGSPAFGTYVFPGTSGPDSSTCGGDWATDTYDRYFQIIAKADSTFEVIRTYVNGSFVTLGGTPQPNGPCGEEVPELAAGITGTFYGYDVLVVTGGEYNPTATCGAGCTTTQFCDAFFPGATSCGVVTAWEYHYVTVSHGTWQNADASRGGNVGNIVA